MLDQFVALAGSEGVDVVIIAGDVYDSSVPPADAVALLDDVLSRLVVDCGIPVVVIAGNHDSAERIGFGGGIFGRQGLHLRGTLDDLSPILLSDTHGTVALHPLPCVEPLFARALPGGEAVCDHQSAMSHVVSMLRAQRVPGTSQCAHRPCLCHRCQRVGLRTATLDRWRRYGHSSHLRRLRLSPDGNRRTVGRRHSGLTCRSVLDLLAVMLDGTASCGADDTVMPSDVPCNATDCSTFQATFRMRQSWQQGHRAGQRKDNQDSAHVDSSVHLSSRHAAKHRHAPRRRNERGAQESVGALLRRVC